MCVCVWEGATKTNEKSNASWFGMAMEKGHLCKSGIGRIVGFFRGETSLAVHQIGAFIVNPTWFLNHQDACWWLPARNCDQLDYWFSQWQQIHVRRHWHLQFIF